MLCRALTATIVGLMILYLKIIPFEKLAEIFIATLYYIFATDSAAVSGNEIKKMLFDNRLNCFMFPWT